VDVIITVDTEADDQWSGTRELKVRNLAFIPRFQDLCERHGLSPTYLCTWEVAEAPEFDDILAEPARRGAAEIGTHLHPWSTPPFDGKVVVDGFDVDWYPAFPSELPLESFRNKLSKLTERLAERAGRRPTSYRSGRWGMAAEHVGPLVELGYVVDSSVTPLKDWSPQRGVRTPGPDFRGAPAQPYRLGTRDLMSPGDSKLWELPMSILQAHPIMRRVPGGERLRTLFCKTRLGRGLSHRLGFDPVWFRPYPHVSAAGLLRVYQAARAARRPYLMMMTHSSELMPGGSPHHPDAPSIEALYEKLDRVFARLAADGCRGATLTEAAQRLP